MADVLPKPDPEVFDNFLRAYALKLRAKDRPPTTVREWGERRKTVLTRFQQAMGPFPDKPCPLEPKVLGELQRTDYRIEKLIFQSRPDVWVTANAYIPSGPGKRPAVLVVHGHWPWARIDPVVQARCLGLVKLGFFVLAVDAFGAGERYTEPARGTYHGALFGSTLWPAGHTLLGMQVYDNRRAIDYLLTRPEVDGEHLGITGASGGGNQSMNAGAADERLQAVVPVCSVGTYQAYLHAACCVCEVLPGALTFTEEGAILALVAPRALMVINATKDAFQFSVGEAEKSIARARPVFDLLGAGEKLRHTTFESGHAYNQPMREAMYGWMTRWLKNEGEAKPVPEPAHTIEKPEDLRCFPDDVRPKGFLFPPTFAAREGRNLLAKYQEQTPRHVEEWESTAVYLRDQLRKRVVGDLPKTPHPAGSAGKSETRDGIVTTPLLLQAEVGLPLPVMLRGKVAGTMKQPACVLLHLDGKNAALEQPLATALVNKGWLVVAPDLRGTGETRPRQGSVSGAFDHNSAEHALWVGRPLLGQWLIDVQCVLDWLGGQPSLDSRRLMVAGVGQAGVIALCAAGIFDTRVTMALTVAAPTTYLTEFAYGAGTSMGLLVPGILRLGDIPQLAALIAPRELIVADGVSPQGRKQTQRLLREAYAFTQGVYGLYRAADKFRVSDGQRAEDLLGGN